MSKPRPLNLPCVATICGVGFGCEVAAYDPFLSVDDIRGAGVEPLPLEAIMQRDVAFARVTFGPSQAVAVSFRYRDRDRAQRTAGWFSGELVNSRRGLALIDPASRPTDRTEDYRLAARFLGLPIGLITGLILGWRRRRIKVPTEILPAT